MRVIIPAAGKGKRLNSADRALPKVMHEILGRPLLETVLENVGFIDNKDVYIVVGYRKDDVISRFGKYGYNFAEQEEQLGTGHAVMACADSFRDYEGTVLVTFGDMPLFRSEILKKLCAYHEETGAACTMLTAENPALDLWARVLRNKEGKFCAIVEGKDCVGEQKTIKELFSGVLAFDSKALFSVLPEVGNENVQKEYYLTEVPELMVKKGMKVETFSDDDGEDLYGVNTPEDMLLCEKVMKKRLGIK